MFELNRVQKIHFIGIGGIGMSAIAEILIQQGYQISGSDSSNSAIIDNLRKKGAKIFIGHAQENIEDVQIVVFSTAINFLNPEIQISKQKNIPIIRRAQMLSYIMQDRINLAVAGSHGKTTTTSMLASIYMSLGYSPTFVIGGVVKNLGGNAGLGTGRYMIVEADESDGSFLCLQPKSIIVTNIDNDHLDYYGNLENLKATFKEFIQKVPSEGIAILNAHDKVSIEILANLKVEYKTIGIKNKYTGEIEIDYLADSIVYHEDKTEFFVKHKNDSVFFEINHSGEHNVLNALAAIALAHSEGISLLDIVKGIKSFEGVARRLDVLRINNNQIILDDYAHHPTEIVATLKTLKQKYTNKKIVTIFEPHRYTRTENFWGEFIDAFAFSDFVYIAPIYPASEKEIPQINSMRLVEEINKKYSNAAVIENLSIMKKIIDDDQHKNDIIVTMGAGPISKVIRGILGE
jgi:UDP-N-acetylmuramate--alanine ligase